MRSSVWQAPPFKLLLHLEWILLGIAVISSLHPISVRLRGLPLGRGFSARPGGLLLMSFLSLLCLLLLGRMGQRLPLGGKQLQTASLGGWVGNSAESSDSNRGVGLGSELGLRPGMRPGRLIPGSSLTLRGLYLAWGFALSWLAVCFGGHGTKLFPPLLLILVTRGCLLFPRRGRWLVAGTALGSFVVMQYLALQRIRPFGIALDRLPRLPGGRRLPEELIQSLRLNAMINVTLLFVLVLGFVLLLVQALLQEAESRQKLAEANQQLRRYSLRIEDQAALQERSRIAREIHDTVGHCLTAQSIQLENVALRLEAELGNRRPNQVSLKPRQLGRDQLEQEQPERDRAEPGQFEQDPLELAWLHLDNARRLGREALQNVRQAVARLRTHPLQGQRLEAAIAKLVQAFQSHNPIPLESRIELPHSPSQDIAIVLYRILQEGLTNLTKHSNATAARLEIYQDGEGLHLQLSDNGQGFDPNQNTTGFGLQSMAERAAAVRGRFQLSSAPGQGCDVELHIPV